MCVCVFVHVQRWLSCFPTKNLLMALILSWPRKSSGVASKVVRSPGFRGQERQRAMATCQPLRTLLLFLQVQSPFLPRKQLLGRHLSLCFRQPHSLCHLCLQGQISQWMELLTGLLCWLRPTFLPVQERPLVKRLKPSCRMMGLRNSKPFWIRAKRGHGTLPTFFHRSLLEVWGGTNKQRLSSARALAQVLS